MGQQQTGKDVECFNNTYLEHSTGKQIGDSDYYQLTVS